MEKKTQAQTTAISMGVLRGMILTLAQELTQKYPAPHPNQRYAERLFSLAERPVAGISGGDRKSQTCISLGVYRQLLFDVAMDMTGYGYKNHPNKEYAMHLIDMADVPILEERR